MPAAELPHRVRERARQWSDSIRDPSIAQPPDPDLTAPLQWPFTPDICGLPAGEQERLRQAARALLDGEFSPLGTPVSALDAWDVDPATGAAWPAFARAHTIDFRHRTAMDVKVVWEVHRLSHMALLAAASQLPQMAGAQDGAISVLTSWLARHRAFRGIEYASGIECAARLINLLLVPALVELPPSLWGPLHEAIGAHVTWIRRYPSKFSSANNHRVAELVAVLCVDTLRGRGAGAQCQKELGELESLIASLVHSDGVGAEQSPSYLAYVLEWALCLRAVRGVAFSAATEARLTAAAEYLAVVVDPAQGALHIGDNDESTVLPEPRAERRIVASIAAATAGAVGKSAAVPWGSGQDLRAALLGILVPESTIELGDRRFPEGGYTVWRRGEASDPRHLLVAFDHGPLGYAFTAAHGHADALAVWVRLGGQPVLVDTGTFAYGDEEWRSFIRCSNAHNTVSVRGFAQSEQTGPFNWGRRANAWRLPSTRGVCATHAGYAAAGVRHQRTVEVVGQHEVIVTDRVDNPQGHEVVGRWLLHPRIALAPEAPGRWRLDCQGEALGSLEVTGEVAVSLVRGRAGPHPGAFSGSYRSSVGAPLVEIRSSERRISWRTLLRLP